MNKVLIFGAEGFVGRYLSEEFSGQGYEVIGVDKNVSSLCPGAVKSAKLDIQDADAVYKIIEDERPEVIINLAAISSVGLSWRVPGTTVAVNLLGTLNILEAVRRIEIKSKVVLIGSSEEYKISEKDIDENTPLNANNPYGISKIAQELFAKLYRDSYGMSIYCVRAFNHTGVGQNESFVLPGWCKQAAAIRKSGKAGKIRVGNIDVERDFCDVRDVVRAYRLIAEKGDSNKVYNVGSGTAYNLESLLKYIIELTGQKIDVEIDEQLVRPSDLPRICCDNSLIYTELGWRPEHNIYDTISEMYKYYLEEQ